MSDQVTALEVLPTSLYTFKLSEDVYNKVKVLTQEINWNSVESYRGHNNPYFGKSTNGTHSLHFESDWKFLVDYLNQKIKEIVNTIEYDRKYFEELEVSLMWANRSELNQWHHKHSHSWSVLSGIIYVLGESGNTWFSRPNDYLLGNPCNIPLVDGKQEIVYIHKPLPGSVVVFPSTLYHSVDENREQESRLTVSFNTFPNGIAGSLNDLAGIKLKIN